MNIQQIEKLFACSPFTEEQNKRSEKIRAAALHLAVIIYESTPGSPEQTLAIRALHQAAMHAISAIAVNE